MPPLLTYPKQADYQVHSIRAYCAGPTITHDGIPVYFNRQTFNHAFFETVTLKDDTFSTTRAERMDWIKQTLQNPAAERYQGWDQVKKKHDPVRRVDVVFEKFVVVLQLTKKQNGTLGAKFITCFQADNSIAKIRRSPRWNREDCERALFGK